MSDPFVCGIIPTGANEQVLKHFSDLDAMTAKYSALALDFTSELGSFQLPNLSFTVQPPSVFNYALKAPGELPALEQVNPPSIGNVPDSPDYVAVPPVTLDAQPGNAPVIPDPNFNSQPPTPYNPSFPALPTMKDVVDPQFGDRTSGILPPVPRTIVLPNAPAIDWDAIGLDVTLPVFNATPPDPKDFAFTPDAYQTQIVADVKPVIEAMLQGNSGLPAAVENAIWARAAERESQLALRAEQEANGTYASKGFTMPGGALNAAIARVRQDAQDKKVTLSRDVMIRMHEVRIEQLKFAVAQGLAYEDLFVRLYTTVQTLRLDAAKFAVNIALSVFQAYVSKFQVDSELARLQLEAKKTQIQIELGKLEGYRDELEAARLIGTLNQQDIEIYNARLNAVLTDAKIYESEIAAAKLVLDENQQLLQQAKFLIDEEMAKLQAKELEVRVYGAEIQAETAKQQAWATRAQSYVAQLGAWSTAQNVKIENARLLLAENENLTRRFEAIIEGFNAKANLVRTQSDIVVARNRTLIDGYSAQNQGNSAYNSALVEQMRGLIAALQQNVELAIKNGEINIQNSLEGKRLQEQALSTATQAIVQVLASSLSGHSTSASISDSSSASGSCSYSTSQVVTG